jgi:hypothetical protein
MYIRPREHTADTSNNVKIIQTTFYHHHQQHKYFNLTIFNYILIIEKLRNFNDILLWNSQRMTNVSKHVGVVMI